jgi:hypothetical protein
MNEFFPSESAMLAAATSLKRLALLLVLIAASYAWTATAHAATFARTWVSGTGTSNTQCSVTQPCATFAQAIAVTSSGGEIDCLDPGDFGTVTISISVTIDCEGASNGGILVGSDQIGITINTAGIVVNLIGLDINGQNTGSDGIYIGRAAYVTIRNCKIYDILTSGILFTSGTMVVDNVFIANNGYGIFEDGDAGEVINMTVRNSDISNNFYGILSWLISVTHVGATIEQTTLAFNDYGLLVEGSGAVALMGGSTVVNNGTGVSVNSGGGAYSFKNNQIGGNGSDGTPLTAYPGGPLN